MTAPVWDIDYEQLVPNDPVLALADAMAKLDGRPISSTGGTLSDLGLYYAKATRVIEVMAETGHVVTKKD